MLAANPGVDPWSPAGRRLTIPSLYILPDAPRVGVVLNLAERRLYYFPPGGKSVQTYPIGIGAIGFTTPLSTTRVVRKEPNPTWVPPPSIRAEEPDLPAVVGPGPENPLGDYALRLGWNNYLIHGTNKPDGVGRNVSHGCIHLYPEDIERLFNAVAVGTPVRAIEQPAAAAWIGIGLYVEAHPSKDQADQIDTEQPVTPEQAPGLREAVAAVAGDHADGVGRWSAGCKAAGYQRTGLPVEVAQRAPTDTGPARAAPRRHRPGKPRRLPRYAGGARPADLTPPAARRRAVPGAAAQYPARVGLGCTGRRTRGRFDANRARGAGPIGPSDRDQRPGRPRSTRTATTSAAMAPRPACRAGGTWAEAREL